MPKKKKEKPAIYQAKNGSIELNIDKNKDTIWASQAEMAFIFGVNSQAITRHLRNIYKNRELSEKSTCSKMEQVQIEGNRTIKRQIKYYNLDAIISVGYRINNNAGTKFRQWATKVLKQYTLDGYVINQKQLEKNYSKFLQAVEETKKLLPDNGKISAKETLDLVKLFAGTWFSLDAYDKDELPSKGVSKRKIKVSSEELTGSIDELKESLIKKGEATDLFARERGKNSLEGVLGNVYQSFGGKEMYPSLEEKAVHLLYFIVKNHPFVDGNKRSGAFAFIWFLNKAGFKFKEKITPEALTVITLLVAESKPKDKNKMIGLVLLLLKK